MGNISSCLGAQAPAKGRQDSPRDKHPAIALKEQASTSGEEPKEQEANCKVLTPALGLPQRGLLAPALEKLMEEEPKPKVCWWHGVRAEDACWWGRVS